MQPRAATAADVGLLTELINAAYVVERFFARGDRTSDAHIRTLMAAAGGAFIVIDSAGPGQLDAAVYVTVHSHRGHLAMLSVRPEMEGRGLARALIGAVEEHCRTAGCSDLDLDIVNVRTELPAFYERFGFVATGPLPFPDPEKLTRPVHLIRMTKLIAP